MNAKAYTAAFAAFAASAAIADTVAWWHFNGKAGADAESIVSSVGNHTLTLNTLAGYPATAYADDSRGDTLYVESGGTKTLLDVFARGCVSMKVTETGGTEQKGLFYTGDVSSILKHHMVDGVPHMRAFTIELYSKLSNTDAGLNFGLRNSKSPNTYSWALAFWLYSEGTQYRADSINADGSVTQGGSFAVKQFRGYTGDDKPFPSDGDWHHFAVVYDGDGTDYYYTTAYDYTEDELMIMAAIIQCEAGTTSYPGMIAVGSVVMNRVESSSFPNTIAGVVYAPYQFEPVSTGTFAVTLAQGPAA